MKTGRKEEVNYSFLSGREKITENTYKSQRGKKGVHAKVGGLLSSRINDVDFPVSCLDLSLFGKKSSDALTDQTIFFALKMFRGADQQEEN